MKDGYSALFLLALLAVVRAQHSAKKKPDALVEMVPGADDKVFGKLALYKQQHGVYIEGIIHNLKPGPHGFHVHDMGLLGNKCMDAGPHFNPLQKLHAGPKDLHRHAGDLGNVFADKNGKAKISIFDGHISLHPRDKTYIGKRSFVVHARPDDLGRGGNDESLRTGNAGGRLSCGIVIVLGHALNEPPPVYRPKPKKPYGHGGGHGGYGKHDGGHSGGHGRYKDHGNRGKHVGHGGSGKPNSIRGYEHKDDDHSFDSFSHNDFDFSRGNDHDHADSHHGFGQSSGSRHNYKHQPKFSGHFGGFQGFGSSFDHDARGGFIGSGSRHNPQRGRELGVPSHPFGFGLRLQSYGSSYSVHRVPAPQHRIQAPRPGFSQPLLHFW
uniref:Superoxide dismutase [Cu-Zn] n=1 Tax=Hirondellea gigas TaxID=1518452 RepID=A0A6A7G4Q8_9CRUS